MNNVHGVIAEVHRSKADINFLTALYIIIRVAEY